MNTLNIQLSFCNARIKHSPQYSLEVAVIFCVNGTTVNPLLPPPPPPRGGLFIPNTFEGSLFEREGLFNLAKAMVSVLYKIK